ncbi:hypothetical protein GE061_018529 [Apolygus lucorum]|uniref:Peptidase S1 domain-containing protein n=1 Tax=Apolygus lucorum TaxID=248454 RepID=A0A8S9XG73_APOLU|nr:hypothetical protein GE061_018529 [Apolygus lucorum]
MESLLVAVVLLAAFRTPGTGGWTTPPPTPQPQYNSDERHSFYSPEPTLAKYTDRMTPPGSWDKEYKLVEHSAHLLAGASEFPWVVNVRVISTGPNPLPKYGREEWIIDGIGNFISPRHILTTCRSVSEFHCIWLSDRTDKFCIDWYYCNCTTVPTKNTPYHQVMPTDRITVDYAPTNYIHKHLYKDTIKRWQFGVFSRVNLHPNSVIVHEKCKWTYDLEYDWAVLFMQFAPNAFPNPLLNTMPAPVLHGYAFDDTRLNFINQRKIICYVATIGQQMEGFPKNQIRDSKIKYRVYPASYNICVSHIHLYCPEQICYKGHWKTWNKKRIECWETRARIGAVCDHDKGAPIVCNGRVEGVVNRAAVFPYCNPGIPLSFLIQRLVKDVPQFLQSLTILPKDPLPVNPIRIPTLRPSRHDYPIPVKCYRPNEDGGTSTGRDCKTIKPHSRMALSSSSLNPISQFLVCSSPLVLSLVHFMIRFSI